MTKHEFERNRDLFIVLGTTFIVMGATTPLRSKPEGPWGTALMVLSTGGQIALGLMQFNLARVLHRRAQNSIE